jgi:hypothetical protein
MTHLAKSKVVNERNLTDSLKRHFAGQETLRNAFYPKFESESAFNLWSFLSLFYELLD